MVDVIIDTLIDAAKLLPFLFVTYLVMEFLEHKMGSKTEKLIKRSGNFGPLIGAVCGCAPQCGFSAIASGFYAGRVITMGTLIAVFLSTSDEMLPIFISKNVGIVPLLSILAIKAVFGIIIGFGIDFICRKRKQEEHQRISELCENEQCHCEKGIFLSAVIHTVEVLVFIVLISFVLNTLIFFIGEESLKAVILDVPVVGELIAGLVGIIPNCASSVIIAELYLSNLLSFGAMMSGLFVGAGVGLLILFRVNKNIKENLIILLILYASGVIGGVLINALGISISI